MVVTVFNLERQAETIRPFVARQNTNCVDALSTDLGNQTALAGFNEFSIETVPGTAHHLRVVNHCFDDSLAGVSGNGIEAIGRRGQPGVHERYRANRDPENRNPTTIDADRYLLQWHV